MPKLRLNTRLKRDMATYQAEPEFKTDGIQLVVSTNNIGEFDMCQKQRPVPRETSTSIDSRTPSELRGTSRGVNATKLSTSSFFPNSARKAVASCRRNWTYCNLTPQF
jgi:hypothetical protein